MPKPLKPDRPIVLDACMVSGCYEEGLLQPVNQAFQARLCSEHSDIWFWHAPAGMDFFTWVKRGGPSG